MGQNFPWNSPPRAAGASAPNGLRGQTHPNQAYGTSTATANTTLTASQITGGAFGVVLAMTGTLAAGATATTDTAANIIAAIPSAYFGQSYRLRVINESSGNFAWTIAGGAGVTITGTATIAKGTWREFVVTLGSGAVTLQSVGTGTYS